MPTEFRLYNVDEKDLYKNKSIEEKEEMLYAMVQTALERGIKPTAREFNTYPATVRKWVNKYKDGGIDALKFKKKDE